MKKTNLTDKIIIGIIVLNLCSFLLEYFFGMLSEKSLLDEIAAINFLYFLLAMPWSVFAGVMMNITSLVWKYKMKEKFGLNILLFIMLLLIIPVWLRFCWIVKYVIFY